MPGKLRRAGYLWCGRAALALASGLAGCARHGTTETMPADAVASGSGVPYVVSIEGLPTNGELRDVLERSLRLYTLAERPPPSQARLRRRAEADEETTIRVLRSEGYYDARVSVELAAVDPPVPVSPAAAPPPGDEPDRASGVATGAADADVASARVTLRIEPGARYRIGELTMNVGGLAPELRLPSAAELGLAAGTPARASAVVDAEGKVVRWLQERGYAYARFRDRDAAVDPAQALLHVTSEFVPGPRVRFGGLRIGGLESVSADYIQTYRTWSPGEYYAASKVRALRQAAQDTGLFELVRAEPVPPETPTFERSEPVMLPIEMTVEEAKHRSIGFGLRYSTDEGPSASTFIEHRNLFGANETGRVSLTAGLIKQELAAAYRKPQFLRGGQALFANAALTNETTDAFDQQAAGVTVGVQREVTDRLDLSVAVSAEVARVEDSDRVANSYLLGLPLGATYDASDSLLDPTRGYRLHAELTPYAGAFDGEPLVFPVMDLRASAYWPVGAHVIAVRGRVASIVGVERDDVPPHKRLYAGGGGSVRGYRLRYVGPLDVAGEPIGGRSAAELGLEWRLRVTDSIGIVPFVEAGAVSESAVPDFDDGVQVAAGLGLRYYTVVGPIRADFAVPVNPREEDSLFQFYVSIGQAF